MGKARDPNLETLGDLLYWAYANQAMAEKAVHDHADEYQQLHFIVRSRLWSGLKRGTMKVGSRVKDQRQRLKMPRACIYCGSTKAVALDHVVSRNSGGRETGDNIVYACRSCNSSKGDRDLLEWRQQRGIFPPLFVLRVYLKEALTYAVEHGIMQAPLASVAGVPFSVTAIPREYPPPSGLIYIAAPPP